MSEAAPSPAPFTRPKATPQIVLRSLVFTAWVYALGALMGIFGLPLLLGSRRDAMGAIKLWARLTSWGLKTIVGARIEVRGLENLPAGPCLIAAKHQGMFDTVAPFNFLADPAFVLKRELMRIPVYGWFASKTEMIAIDREGGAKTLRAMVQAARSALDDGRQIVIFPEGTRKAPGDPPDYQPGVAGLYRDLGVSCTPMATNSGQVWPAHGFIRYPERVVFEILPPIQAGLKRATFMAILEDAVETASTRLIAETGPV
jgi:1-acyl-sn-glycerol-3-phosphate acyltransferase